MSPDDQNCAHCGGAKNVRNPTGECDHLYWPELLSDAAKRANGFVLVEVVRQEWRMGDAPDVPAPATPVQW